jgi:isoleucyl-tRNA synthetase
MYDFKQAEKDVLKFWKKNRIYEKSRKKNAKGKKFYLMDGPPYATGHIHMGTALNKILKDVAMRSKRLQGCDVFDRPGYDTHGVPIEIKVEKEIGSNSKQDIERFGVKKFIDKCRKYATEHIDLMNSEFENLGVWMDWKNPYLTLDDKYIEAIWSAFKEADKKGLLYLGKYSVHVCPRCETAVSYNEIEYGKQKDTSVFVKFKLKDKKNTFLIIWTTTPWTLPANTGVMVHPEVIYQEIETSEGERWIIAKDLVPSLMAKLERGYTAKAEYKGKEMKNWIYENPLSKNLKLKIKNGYKVVLSARYVTIEDGTGLVHCAPGHGREDYEVGKENGLDMPSPVALNGFLTEEAGKYAGKKARIVDKEIIEDLEKNNALVYKMDYTHDYPLCWRDKEPLLMISQPQWFFKISEIQKKLIKYNDEVYWIPEHMKQRMKAWLEGISDWPVSRQRYWGTPLPIWVNEKGERLVVGSIKELEKLSGKRVKEVHKPGIDDVVIVKNGKTFKRIPEVLDVWFDSGVSSWAALSGEKDFKRYWPADLNIEGRDQFRGWWNSQLILSEIAFGKKPYEAISVHGMVLDLDKKKMSKSLGNVVSPEEIIEKYGRDYMRYYFAKFSKGEDFAYGEDEFRDIRNVVTILLNVNNYVNQLEKGKKTNCIEDKWILSKYNKLLEEVRDAYDKYDFSEVIEKLEQFVVNDLSRTYIKLTRERAEETYSVLEEIRRGLLIILAPIMPFLTESLFRELKQKEESVHLCSWPKADKKKRDSKLEEQFLSVLKIIETGLTVRDKAQTGLKWPLAKATVFSSAKLKKEMQEIVMRQLNVKKLELKNSKETKVELDLTMTKELEAEGFARELARNIQSERKKAGLKKGQLIELKINCDNEMKDRLKPHFEFLRERTNSKTIMFTASDKIKNANVFTIKGIQFTVGFS